MLNASRYCLSKYFGTTVCSKSERSGGRLRKRYRAQFIRSRPRAPPRLTRTVLFVEIGQPLRFDGVGGVVAVVVDQLLAHLNVALGVAGVLRHVAARRMPPQQRVLRVVGELRGVPQLQKLVLYTDREHRFNRGLPSTSRDPRKAPNRGGVVVSTV